MLMTILNAGKGHSGIRIGTLDLIRKMLNLDLIPFAPSEGSVGYLGVEAHLVMAYMGEGKIFQDGKACLLYPSPTATSGRRGSFSRSAASRARNRCV